MKGRGTMMAPDRTSLIRRVVAIVLAIAFTITGTVATYAASSTGPHLRLAVGQSDILPVRFISPDSLDPTLPGVGTNRYSYSQNDPVNKSDPTGHICVPCAVAIGIIGSLLSGTEEANAPGPEEEIEDPSEAEALANMAIGAVPGAATEKFAAATIGRVVGSRISVWSLGNATRGFAIEAKLGGNLAHNFRTIDFWDPNSGIAKSIKSINLDDKKYMNPKRLESQLRTYLNAMKNFKGGAGLNKRGKTVVITGKSINKKKIEIAIPGKPNKGTPEYY
jgi:hypothetical protein